MRALLARRKIVVPVAVAVIVLVGVGLWAFQPWKLFTSSTVNEKLADGAVQKGTFRTLAHPTSGQAEIVKGAGGSYTVQLRDFSTSDGPAVHVWLTDKAQDAGDAAFGRDGHLDLGNLKATNGNEVYAVPAGTDIAQYKSVLVWCERFSVGFGVAGLGA
ncbi:DM13 domain-containing protein [Kutzneria sp. 744]|uniref:DM13 domain-containing protein n=1 Tax=Kutzneria sp. (strain 744) TaxID=345341 RepID=UPI0003EED937|nr:DM13 domain-containing protein [Kutzneria sp. 744]EWM17180.1 secreted protein [Kutzneria sp. 744]